MPDLLKARTAELGIPDWHEPSAYPTPYGLSISDWRWEFLRRNPRYRQDYQKPETAFVDLTKHGHFQQAYELGEPVDPRVSAKEYVEENSRERRDRKSKIAFKIGDLYT